ncbi:MAG: hypothetical protein OFPII_22920 [Osedax symbiont Rs1]|nr:MAG: hypothetical protein OFPII_22920 [Osedax symbiont Rs1]
MISHITVLLITLSLLFSSSFVHSAGNWQHHQDQAMSLYKKGHYTKAEQKIKRALSIASKADNGAKFKASSLNLLAFIENAQGKSALAVKSIQQAITLTKKLYGKRHPQVAILLYNKGSFLEQLNRDKSAFSAYSEAWKIQRTSKTAARSDTLKTLNAWLRLSNKKRQYANSLQQASPFLKTMQRANTQHFSEGLRQLSYALAEANIQQKQPLIAQQILNKQLATQRRQLKASDPRIADTLERLANSLALADQTKKALSFREQAQKIRASSGTTTLANAMYLNELALDSQAQKHYQKATKHYQKALLTLAELHRDKGIEQALILANFGSLHEAQGADQQALKLYQQSMTLHDTIKSKPLQAAFTATRAGSIFYKRGKFKRTEVWFLQALSLVEEAEKSAGPQEFHKVTLENLVTLYSAWRKNNKRIKYKKQLKALKK